MRRGGFSVSDASLDLLDAQLAAGEFVRFVATPIMWYSETGARTAGSLGVAVTSKRLLIVKKKIFSGLKVSDWPIEEFGQYAVGLFMGGGPAWEVVEIGRRGEIKLVFDTGNEAEALAESVNSGVAFARVHAS